MIEVACKEWNGLPSLVGSLSGRSYDNTGSLDGVVVCVLGGE